MFVFICIPLQQSYLICFYKASLTQTYWKWSFFGSAWILFLEYRNKTNVNKLNTLGNVKRLNKYCSCNMISACKDTNIKNYVFILCKQTFLPCRELNFCEVLSSLKLHSLRLMILSCPLKNIFLKQMHITIASAKVSVSCPK